MKENLYSAAALLATPREAVDTGEHSALSELTSLRTFVSSFAAHIAAEAVR